MKLVRSAAARDRREMKTAVFAALLICLAACTPQQAPVVSTAPVLVPPDAWIIANGTLIDGVSAEPTPDAVVVIRGERIWAAGPAEGFLIPETIETVDAGGGTILPGLIDAHVHYTSSPITRSLFLREGVTAVCDTGSSRAAMLFFADDGDGSAGPPARGFKSGPMLAPHDDFPGVYFGVNVNYEVAGAVAARTAVDDLASRGADYIKISLEAGEDGQPHLTPAETQAAVAAAHAHGLKVRAHARTTAAFRQALEAGVDVIEHAPAPEGELERGPDGTIRLPPEFTALLEQAAETGIMLVPTLHALIDETDRPEALLAAVGHFHRSGGRVALGNDYGTPGVPVGLPLGEMELLRQAGLTPMQVLQAGTRLAAEACGQGRKLGTVEPGKLADLIVVAGDPLADLHALEDVRWVVLGGRIVEPLTPE